MNNLDFLKTRYINLVNPKLPEVKQKIKEASLVDDENSQYIKKPDNVPDLIWDKVNAQQKYRLFYEKLLASWSKEVENNNLDFSPCDLLKIMYPERNISPEAAKLTTEILRFSDFNDINCTIPALLDYVDNALAKQEPIKIRMSHCINRGVIYRSNAYPLALKGLKNQSMDKFSEGVEIRGWHQARALLQHASKPIKLEIYLGDMDYYILEDSAENILDQASLTRLKDEMVALKNDTQEKATNFFAGQNVEVNLWSERYNVEAFNEQFELVQKSKDNLDKNVQKVIKERRGDYYRLWGYAEMAEKVGVSFQELDNSIYSDLYRMTAQYKLESELSKSDGCIQGISEASSNVTLPVIISHALRQDMTPFLFIGAVDNYSKSFDIVS